MADISKIKATNGTTYSLKDSTARARLVPTGGTTGQILTKTASGYGWEDGVPTEVVTAWQPTGMTQLDIRQLAEHGGVNPIAPVTVPEAVMFEDGSDLTDYMDGTSFTILANGWGNATTINSTNYYPYVVNLTAVFSTHPTIGIGTANVLPTEAEQTAFDLWKYAVVDDTNLTLTLYAESIPVSDFIIIVKGVV